MAPAFPTCKHKRMQREQQTAQLKCPSRRQLPIDTNYINKHSGFTKKQNPTKSSAETSVEMKQTMAIQNNKKSRKDHTIMRRHSPKLGMGMRRHLSPTMAQRRQLKPMQQKTTCSIILRPFIPSIHGCARHWEWMIKPKR